MMSSAAVVRRVLTAKPRTTRPILAGRVFHEGNNGHIPQSSTAPPDLPASEVLNPLTEFKGVTRQAILPEGIDLSDRISGLSAKLKRAVLPHFWLRDNCRCSSCVNSDTKQRNFNTFDIRSEIRAKDAFFKEDTLYIVWEGGHKSKYSWSFLSHYLTHDSRSVVADYPRKQLWGAVRHTKNPPVISYNSVMDPKSGEFGVAALTSNIMEHGFVFVKNTPVSPEATQKLLERIAFVRQTHYGGFYDFIPDLAMADTAYTNLALPAHTDTTYFTDPAGLQAFHLLSHDQPPAAASAEQNSELSFQSQGGKSLLVDGFAVAEKLRWEDRDAFEVLSKVRLSWHASGNKGITISPDKRYPVLEVDDRGDVRRIRWNNDDRGVVPIADRGFSADDWYAAARKWNNILLRKDIEYWVQLEPGTTLIFDNWRVLHGRSAFKGVRRICGGYINRDDFISRWRNTNLKPQQILESVVG